MALRLERRVADQKLVHQDPKAPDVDPLVVLFPFNHFGGQVVQRPAECLSARRRGVDGPAEISNLQLSPRPKQQILRLNVPVNNVLFVAIPEGRRHFQNELRRLPLRKVALIGKVLVELSMGSVLKNQVDAFVVIKITIHAQDIFVS